MAPRDRTPTKNRNQMMADSDERQDAGQSLLHTKGRGGGDYVDDQGVGAEYGGSVLRSIWALFHGLFWVPVIGAMCLSCVFLVPFIGLARSQNLVWRCATIYFRITLWATGISYTIVGLENLNPDENYFFACNHESIFDIPVAFAAFPFWLIAIAKKIIAYFPIFGWAVALGGTIFVQRSNHKKALDSLNAGQKSLQEKPRSVLLFPEGTRSDDGVVRPFKKGGLILAIQSGMPCVPVAICGTRRIVGRAVDRFEPIVACRVKVVIGKPIKTEGMTFEQRDTLTSQLHSEVCRLKGLWERGVGAESFEGAPESFLNCWRPMPKAGKPWYGRIYGAYEKDFSQSGKTVEG